MEPSKSYINQGSSALIRAKAVSTLIEQHQQKRSPETSQHQQLPEIANKNYLIYKTNPSKNIDRFVDRGSARIGRSVRIAAQTMAQNESKERDVNDRKSQLYKAIKLKEGRNNQPLHPTS